ncbi:MAG: hypothetical protein WDA29_11060 [Flavobacteriaceae bacterium]
MTCVIGFVDHDIGMRYIAGDSDGYSDSAKTALKSKKIFEKNNMLIGYCGSFRLGQLLEYVIDFPRKLKSKDELAYLVQEVVPMIRNCFNESSDIEHETFSFLFVMESGAIFEVESNYQIMAHDRPYVAIGSGRDVADGYCYSVLKHEKENDGLKLHKRNEDFLEEAIRCASQFVPSVGGRVDVLSSKIKE